ASEVFFGTDGGRIGGEYLKVIYEEYTDDTFTTLKPTLESLHLGILGPVLRAEEGDTLRVTFMNKADRNFSIQPHGLHYDKHFQGTSYEDGVDKPGSHVAPGQKLHLHLAGTPALDWWDLCSCKKGTLGENGTQKGVDKEFFLLFSVMDEQLSWYIDENIEKFGSNETNVEDEDFKESNLMHAVNGRMYGNLQGLQMCAGTKLCGEHLQEAEHDTRHSQPVSLTQLLLPYAPNTPGVHEVSCRVTDHFSAGMRQQYRVDLCPRHKLELTYKGGPTKIVQYFISADEIVWDFSPNRDWEMEIHHGTLEDSPGNMFVGRGGNKIGSRYKKVVYREYTDESFTVEKKRQPEQQHLGIMGPIIKAEVGEQIVITFKNNASRPYSISAHGVKASGAHIPVKPGNILELTWDVPNSSGPGVSDPNCISYAYYSNDLYSGLLGPLVICRPGTLQRGEGPDRQRDDVEKEFALLFMVHDENQSWYLDENIKTYLGADPDTLTRDEDFQESNKMHGINGLVYGNLHGLVMTRGQKVDWYLLGMGTEVDMHTVHFHAETFTYKTVEMVAGNPGTWLLHCHVTDHIHAGMETTFTIKGHYLLSLALCLMAVGGLQ
ncbi:hypothetical protein KUCAC02_003042, partial [Chaenocephalus aceratus]